MISNLGVKLMKDFRNLYNENGISFKDDESVLKLVVMVHNSMNILKKH